MSENEGVLLPPAEAMRALGVSASGLRRYASIYENIHGDMPRDNQGRRLWHREAVDALHAAKGLVDAGKVASIGAALEGLQDAPQTMIEAAANLGAKLTDEALNRLLERLGSVDRLEQEVRFLREQVERQNDMLADLVGRHLDQGKQADPVSDENMSTPSTGSSEPRPGVFVKAAQKLERWLRWK